MNWSYDNLWSKAKIYVERAFSEPRTSPLFPLWATIALEFLGRATLAKVHPSLLADPRNDDNILYVFGYGNIEKPRSIPAKVVFLRCQAIVPDFTGAESVFAMMLMEKRNAELHSGGLPYEDFPTQSWLAKYFQVCKLLLDFLGLSLVELFGEEDGRIAQQMIEAASEERKTCVLKRIAAHRTIFENLDPEEQREKRETGSLRSTPKGHPSRVVACPSCGSRCRITGEEVRTDLRLKDDELAWETVVLPTYLSCPVCNLELKGHESLHIAQLGGQFSVEKPVDPADLLYEEYYEPEPPWK